MILLALAKIVGHLENLILNTRRRTTFHYTLPTVNYLTSPRRNSLPPSSHQHSRNVHRLFTNNPDLFKDFSSTTRKCSKHFHQKPENIQRLFRLQQCLSRKSSAPENIQRLFRLQNCLSRNLSAPEKIQRLFRLQNCLSRNSSIFRKHSKTFHQQPENIQRVFRLQNCLSRKSSAPLYIQRLFRMQSCRSCKSSIFRKYSKNFRPAATSKSNQQQQLAAAINSSNQ